MFIPFQWFLQLLRIKPLEPAVGRRLIGLAKPFTDMVVIIILYPYKQQCRWTFRVFIGISIFFLWRHRECRRWEFQAFWDIHSKSLLIHSLCFWLSILRLFQCWLFYLFYFYIPSGFRNQRSCFNHCPFHLNDSWGWDTQSSRNISHRFTLMD